MAAIKISTAQKHEFVALLAKKVFEEKIKESKAKISEATLAVYNVVVPEEVRKTLEQMPPYMVKKIETLKVVIGGCHGACADDFARLPRALPAASRNATFVSYHCENRWEFPGLDPENDSYKHSDYLALNVKELVEKLTELKAAIKIEQDLGQKRLDFEEKIKSALHNIKTAEKLKATYPELAEEWEALLGPFVKSTGLPAVIIDDCLDLIRQASTKKEAA